MRSRCSTFGAADVKGRGLKLHVCPLQFTELTGTQPVPKRNQDHGRVPVAVAVVLSCRNQLLDFALGQMLTRPELAVRAPYRHDCPYFFGWGDQMKVRFAHVFRLFAQVHCPHSRKNTDSVSRQCWLNS